MADDNLLFNNLSILVSIILPFGIVTLTLSSINLAQVPYGEFNYILDVIDNVKKSINDGSLPSEELEDAAQFIALEDEIKKYLNMKAFW